MGAFLIRLPNSLSQVALEALAAGIAGVLRLPGSPNRC